MGRKPSKAEKSRQRKAAQSNAATANARAQAKGHLRSALATLAPQDRYAAIQAKRRAVQLEESAFAKLSPPVLEKLNILASYAVLVRPIQPKTARFGWQRFGKARSDHHQQSATDPQHAQHYLDHAQNHPLSQWLASSLSADAPSQATDPLDDGSSPISGLSSASSLPCNGPEQAHELRLPKRPRWRSDMDTKTVQSNEDEVFRAWLRQTDATVEHAFFTSSPLFRDLQSPATRSQAHSDPAPAAGTEHRRMGGARMTANLVSVDEIRAQQPQPDTAIIGSLYERNVEVFRQLWRVCERSDLVCVLADARCPPLHLPPSLTAFLERYMRLKVVIVLTKADIVPAPIVEAWKAWLQRRFPAWSVVATESYAKLERMEGQGARTRFAPYLSPSSRSALFAALRRAHADLIKPPPAVRDDLQRLTQWSPPCATDVDWEGIEQRVSQHSDPANDDGSDEDESLRPARAADSEDEQDPAQARPPPSAKQAPPPFLTVGLIGQPNVGKSSLLNALFGAKVVRASKTPGKTKHFQTHFLSPSAKPRPGRRGEIRLCDSPGLVFPSLIGMEMQVMGAILPISQVQALTSVVRFVGQHMPLEQVTRVCEGDVDDEGSATKEWTSVAILERVAERYGWRTAKANRWDVNRAGNAVMRAVAEGRVRWAFRPPADEGQDPQTSPSVGPAALLDEALHKGDGVWLDGHAKGFWDEAREEDVLLQDRDGGDAAEAPESPSEAEDEAAKRVRFEGGEGHGSEGDPGDVDESEEEEDEGAAAQIASSTSRFAALMVEDDADEETDSECEDGDDNDDDDADGGSGEMP